MIGELECVIIDCPSPHKLAEFYRTLIGGEVNKPDPRWLIEPGWATLHTPSGLVFCFAEVADYQPPRWPDPDAPRQFHIDLKVPDLDEAGRQVIEAGGALLDDGGGTRRYRIFADPVGHPFCIIAIGRPPRG